MTKSSDSGEQRDDLDLRWDPAVPLSAREQPGESYTPGVPRDLEPYLRFLEEVMPDDTSPGPANMPIDERFEL